MSYSPIFISGNGLRLVSVSLCKARPGSALRRRGCVWWGTRSTGVPVILGQISYLSRYSCWSGAQFENVNDHLFHLLLPWKGKKWRLFCTTSQQPSNLLSSHFHSGFIYFWTKFLQIKNPLLSFIFIFMLRHLEEHFKHLKFYKQLLSLGNNELFCQNTIWALGNLAK